MSYESFQNQVSSEKILLATLSASKRLMAWTLHSGSIYKLENFDVPVITSIEDSGNTYTEVQSIAACTASKFYNDRENKVLYLRTTGSDNPNGRFLALTYKLFFANVPFTGPYDLNTGTDVYWEPTIKSTSAFGVEIDFVNQTGEAIEGSGTLTLLNDNDFWPANFDKLVFENNPCLIYSYNREIDDVTQAKLLFSGYVEKKTYSSTQIQFSLKDLLSNLKDPIQLANIEELGLRNKSDLNEAKQRMIIGRVYGHRPVNLDEVLDGYPLTGTLAINSGTNVVTGTGTLFLAELSPDDVITIGGEEYTVATISSNTSLEITENYSALASVSGEASVVIPDRPKRYMNREWLVAGHALRQPTTVTEAGSTITRINVGSTKDMYAGDWIVIDSEQVRISSILSSKLLILATSLIAPPSAGVAVFKPAIQRVRLDDVLLRYDTDYSFDAETGLLTLEESAEANSSPLKQLTNTLTFNSTRIVTGTNLKATIKSGYMVGCLGQAEMFEVLSVDSDTQLSLRTAATFSDTETGTFKDYIFDPESSVLTCEVLGRTADGTPEGELLDTAPKVIRQFLIDMDLESMLNEDSFTAAMDISQEAIGLVIPEKYDDTATLTYKDVFNKINPSVFGSLIQDTELLLSYLILQPRKSSTALRLTEADVLDLKLASASDKVIKTAKVFYRPIEYDYLTKNAAQNSKQRTSDNAQYLLRIKRERTFQTVLADEADAERHAGRWSLILESSSGSIDITTKLHAMNLEIGSVVDLTHRKLYERFGSSSKRKLGLVESVKKTATEVQISLIDLSNTFNKVASVNSLETNWSNTDEDGRIYGGFITDDYGLIDDDPISFGLNIIW